MDIHKLMQALGESACNERQKYHLTLGQLIEALKDMPPSTRIETDGGTGVSRFTSYRGYYEDLGLTPDAEFSTAGALLNAAQEVLNSSLDGYKGGDYFMGPETPLWLAEWGSTGNAIIGIERGDGVAVLITKDVS